MKIWAGASSTRRMPSRDSPPTTRIQTGRPGTLLSGMNFEARALMPHALVLPLAARSQTSLGSSPLLRGSRLKV